MLLTTGCGVAVRCRGHAWRMRCRAPATPQFLCVLQRARRAPLFIAGADARVHASQSRLIAMGRAEEGRDTLQQARRPGGGAADEAGVIG